MSARLVKAVCFALLLCLGTTAKAGWDIVLNVDVDGRLQGASNVLVDGAYYDVQFAEGSCVSLYNGCDDPSDFPFPPDSLSGATLAGEALLVLLTEVLVDVPGVGNFDTDPRLTNGCMLDVPSFEALCIVLLPYAGGGVGGGVTFPAALRNDANPNDFDDVGSFVSFPADFPGGPWFEDTSLTWSVWTPSQHDSDNDGVINSEDNCTLVANANQSDSNADGFGNRCDPDVNNDGIVNFIDISQWIPSFGTANVFPDSDFDGDGQVTFLDFSILRQYFLQSPGPSGVADEPFNSNRDGRRLSLSRLNNPH